MKLGDVGNADAQRYGKPLEGVRVLAAEQMQALPFGTQLMTRLGAEVVKVEHPVHGESGRGAFLQLVPHFDVVAENFKAGAMARLGLGYEDVAKVDPKIIYLSISGFGNTVETPYDWPAYAPIVEAMSGIYEYKRPEDQPPVPAPAGALGDIGTSMFGVIGVLAALRHRDQTGEGQYVDVSMFDAMVSMTDLVTNFWSMGLRPGGPGPLLIMDGFRASDGWFIMQVGREHQFERLAALVGHPEWVDDPRFATRQGWREHLEDVIRPAVEEWASTRTKLDACHELSAAGVAAGPSNTAADVIADPHVEARNMLVELPRTDDVDDPVLIPGNPVKLSKMADGPETRVPWVGEHTDEVLHKELGLSDTELAALRAEGVIS